MSDSRWINSRRSTDNRIWVVLILTKGISFPTNIVFQNVFLVSSLTRLGWGEECQKDEVLARDDKSIIRQKTKVGVVDLLGQMCHP